MTPPSLRSGFVPLRGCLAVVCVVVRSFRGLPQARGGLRPCVLGLPRPRNYARALLLPWRRLLHCAYWRTATLRRSARGPIPALSFPLAGPHFPAAPRGLRPKSGSRGYAPPIFCRLRRQTQSAGCVRLRARAVCLRVGRDGRALTCWRVGRARIVGVACVAALPAPASSFLLRPALFRSQLQPRARRLWCAFLHARHANTRPTVSRPHPQTAGCVGYAAAPAVWVCRLRVTVWRFPPPLFKLTRLARRPRNNLTAFGWREPPHAEQTHREAWGRSSVAHPPHPQSDPLSLLERVARRAPAKKPLNKVKYN